jgi:mannose-6-phosphate isomerase-like protein (cupin superfamily)
VHVFQIDGNDLANLVLCDTPLTHAQIQWLPAGNSISLEASRRIQVVLCVIKGEISITVGESTTQLRAMQGVQIPGGQCWSAMAGAGGAQILQVNSLHPEFDPACSLMPPLQKLHRFDIADGYRLVYTDYVRGGILRFGPHAAADRHFHQGADELFWFLRGTCRVTTPDAEVTLPAGTIIYTPAGESHIIANATDEPLLMFVTVTPNIVPSHTFFTPEGQPYIRSMAPLTKP